MRTILACSLITLVAQLPLAAADKPNPYNGGEPVAFETKPNGAIVNARLGRDPYKDVGLLDMEGRCGKLEAVVRKARFDAGFIGLALGELELRVGGAEEQNPADRRHRAVVLGK